MPQILEVDGRPIEHPMGLSIYEVRFIPGTGWEKIDSEIQKIIASGETIYDGLKPEHYDLSLELKPGLILSTPFYSSNMQSVTDVKMAIAMNNAGGAGVLHQFAPINERVEWVRELVDKKVDRSIYPKANVVDSDETMPVFAAVGYSHALEEAQALIKAGARGIIFDTSNAYTPTFRFKVERAAGEIRNMDGGGDIFLAAGNVATAWVVEDLLSKRGMDMVKVGIGSGVPCDTPEHGAHVPQLGAIHETARVAEALDKGVIYDGGAKNPFAQVVALTYGPALSGSYWAATEESAGTHFQDDMGNWFVVYQGSASTQDREERRQKYPDKYEKLSYRPSEGQGGPIKVQGTVQKVIERTERTVRLMMNYVGAYDLDRRVFTLAKLREYTVYQRLSEEALRQLNKTGNFAQSTSKR